MADLAVLYDPQLQLAAVIDADTMRALGPVGAGPHAQAELGQFVDRMPAAVFDMSSYELCRAWAQFWEANFAGLYEAPTDGDGPALEQLPHSDDDAAALAEHTATAAAGAPPPPAPADTDMEADTGEADTVTPAVDPSIAPTMTSGAAPIPTAEPSVAVAESGVADGEPEPPPYEGPCFACQGKGTVPGATEGEQATCNLCGGSGHLSASA